jgi:hypothetical protein
MDVCLGFFVFVLTCVGRGFTRVGPSSKESYQMCINKIPKSGKLEALGRIDLSCYIRVGETGGLRK